MFDGDVASHADRGRGDRAADRRHGGDQGPGARRRAGQGGRREAGPQPGRGRRRGGPDPGHDHQGAHRPQGAGGARRRDRDRELRRAHHGPRDPAARCSWSAPRAAWTSRKSPRRPPRRSSGSPWIPTYGLFPHQALSLAFVLYRDFNQVKAAAKIMEQLYRAFVDNGASLAEINPLVTTPDGQVLALDAKIVHRRQRALLATRSGRAARRLGGGAERGGGAARQPLASSSSTATSAAW